jgi:phage baseplate assembly protein W
MRAGMDAETGRLLTGWEHCLQSIRCILTTRIGERVMRRAFGSLVPEMQDRNANARNILATYAAIADAIARWEPGFRLRSIRLTAASAGGAFSFEIGGDFFPRGHLGDYSQRESVAASIGVAA